MAAYVYELYRRAGMPGTRQLSAHINARNDLPDTVSHEGISSILRGANRPRWTKVESLVRGLASWRDEDLDPSLLVSGAQELWQRMADEEEVDGRWAPVGKHARAQVIERLAGQVTVRFEGDVDVTCTQEVRRVLEGAAEGRAGITVTVDLRSVHFIDSTIIGVLVGQSHRTQDLGGQFLVSVATVGLPRRALQLMGMDRIITVVHGGGAGEAA